MEQALTAHGPGLPALIRSIYECALDAHQWPEFLVQFGAEFASEMTLIWAQDFSNRSIELSAGPSALTAIQGVDAHFLSTFEQHFHHCNVWTQDERLHAEGQVVNSTELFCEDQLLHTEWYGDWLRPQGLFYSFAAVVEKRHQRSFNLTALRTRQRGPYSPSEIERLRALMPHLQTAFALHRRLHRAEALAHASLAVVDQLPMGVVLLGEQSQVLHANPRARALIQETGLLQLHAQDRLSATRPADDAHLQHTMRLAVSTGMGLPLSAGAALRLHGVSGQQLQVLVTPLPRGSEPFGAHAAGAVFLSDAHVRLAGLEGMLRNFYRLTPAEAQLAQALVNGWSPQEYADQHSLSIHTVRSQFKSAAGKLGVSRQADLVRTILTGPVMMRWNDSLQPTQAAH
jgi:DNA-binding CsgD family transcriptional regulator/PAS domain-containing protein